MRQLFLFPYLFILPAHRSSRFVHPTFGCPA